MSVVERVDKVDTVRDRISANDEPDVEIDEKLPPASDGEERSPDVAEEVEALAVFGQPTNTRRKKTQATAPERPS